MVHAWAGYMEILCCPNIRIPLSILLAESKGVQGMTFGTSLIAGVSGDV